MTSAPWKAITCDRTCSNEAPDNGSTSTPLVRTMIASLRVPAHVHYDDRAAVGVVNKFPDVRWSQKRGEPGETADARKQRGKLGGRTVKVGFGVAPQVHAVPTSGRDRQTAAAGKNVGC